MYMFTIYMFIYIVNQAFTFTSFYMSIFIWRQAAVEQAQEEQRARQQAAEAEEEATRAAALHQDGQSTRC